MTPEEILAEHYGSKKADPAQASKAKTIDNLISEIYGNQSAIVAAPVTPPNVAGFDPTPAVEPSAIRNAMRIPIAYGNSVAKHGGEAITQIARGGQEIFKNQPASGLGNVGMGLLGVVTAPFEPIVEGAEKVGTGIGGETFGKKVGLATSLAIPLVPGYKFLTAPERRAFKSFVKAIGPENIGKHINELTGNPRLSSLDLSENVRQMTQKLFMLPGNHQDDLVSFVNKRTQGAGGAVKDAMDASMGKAPNVFDKLEALKNKARETGKTKIQPAIEGAGPVDVSSLIKHLDDVINPTVLNIKSGLPSTEIQDQAKAIRKLFTNDKEQQFSAKNLHEFQSIMRKDAMELINSTDGASRRQGHALMDLRSKLVNAIDDASPRIKVNGQEIGSYKHGLSSYKDDMDIGDAFNKGYNISKNRSGQWDDHPDFFAQWTKGLNKDEIEAAKEGARAAYRDTIGRVRNPRGQAGTELVNQEFNIEKLKSLFGEEEINTMLQKLSHERGIAKSNDRITENSMTAMRLAADDRVPKIIDKNAKVNLQDYIPLGLDIAALVASGGTVAGAVPAVIAANALKKYVATPLSNKRAVAEAGELSRLMQTSAKDTQTINRLKAAAPVPKLSLGQKLKLLTGP